MSEERKDEQVRESPEMRAAREWEEWAKKEAERRGWLTGDIHQTDKWFRS